MFRNNILRGCSFSHSPLHKRKKISRMKTAIYSVHKFERSYLLDANNNKHEFILLEEALSDLTAHHAAGCKAICIFVSDKASASVLNQLKDLDIKFNF